MSDYFLSAFPILILQDWTVLAYGSWRYVGWLFTATLGTNFRNDSTGSLSLVRIVLNYQNVTNEPTCRTSLAADAEDAILLLTLVKGLSIPNWYWRTWEVLFGVVAACIPTLRPMYKWLVQELTRLTSRNKSSKPTSNRSAMKPSKAIPTQTFGTKFSESAIREDLLPLQNLEGAGGSQKIA